MDFTIRNSDDLKSAIFHLEGIERQQNLALKTRFSSPGAIISTVFSLFSGKPGTEGVNQGGFFSQDFLGLVSRFVIPLFLNKTIFKNSNFLIKTLVGVLSQKASHYVSEDSIARFFHKVKVLLEGNGSSGGMTEFIKSLFETKKKKKGVNHPTHTPTVQNVLKADA